MPMPTRMPHEVSLEEVASRLMRNQKPGCNKDFCFQVHGCLSILDVLQQLQPPQEWAGQQSDRSSPGQEDEEVTSVWTDPETLSTKVASKVAIWTDTETVTSKVAGCLPDPGVSTKTDEIVDC